MARTIFEYERFKAELAKHKISRHRFEQITGIADTTFQRNAAGRSNPGHDFMSTVSVALSLPLSALFTTVREEGDIVLAELEDAA